MDAYCASLPRAVQDSTPEAAVPSECFELVSAPIWSGRWLFFMALYGLFASATVDFLHGQLPTIAIFSVLLLAVGLGRTLLLRRQPRLLELRNDLLVVPGSLFRPTLSLPLLDLNGAYLVGGRRPGLVLSTPQRVIVLPAMRFRDPTDAARAMAAVLRRLRDLPGGLAKLEHLAELLHEEIELSQRPMTFTWGLFAVLVAVFLGELTSGALEEPLGLLKLGASSAPLDALEPWRLVTAPFLHASGIHIFVNGFALVSLGSAVERLFGWPRFALIYLASAVGGSLLSSRGSAVESVGASGALFGLLGALAVAQIRLGARLPPGFRQTHRAWLGMAVINGGLALLPFVDWRAHAGGLAAGTLLSWSLLRRGPAREVARPSIALEIVAALVAAAVTLVLAFGAAQVTAALTPEGEATLLSALTAHDDQPLVLNQVAWQIVTEEHATRANLEKARAAAERAFSATHDPNDADTLAVTLYRLGRHDEALALESKAAHEAHTSSIFTMLTRFDLAETAPSPTWVAVKPAADGRCELSLTAPRAAGFHAAVAMLDDHGSPLQRAELTVSAPPLEHITVGRAGEKTTACRLLEVNDTSEAAADNVYGMDPTTLQLPLETPRD